MNTRTRLITMALAVFLLLCLSTFATETDKDVAAAKTRAKVETATVVPPQERTATRTVSPPTSTITEPVTVDTDTAASLSPTAADGLQPVSGEDIHWQVIATGGSMAASPNYQIGQTVGQQMTGIASSSGKTLISGFWQNFASVYQGCCGLYTGGYTGNTDCDTEGKMALADIARLIDRVYLSKAPLCCEENGNVDGDPEDKMSLADVIKLIDHVYLSKQPTATCR